MCVVYVLRSLNRPYAKGSWAPGVVVSVGRLTSRPLVQFPVEGGRAGGFGGRGRCHRARSWVLHVPGRDGRWEKMVNKYAAIVYIGLNAGMIERKKGPSPKEGRMRKKN